MDKATTTRAIIKLIKIGYVRRERDPQDLRAYRLFVTPKAREIAPEIRRVLQAWAVILTEGLTDEEKEMASALLRHMRNNVLRYKAVGEGE